MKILYASGKLNDSNIRLSHFLRHTPHEVKVAAYYNNSECLNKVHWMMDALYYGETDSKSIESYIGHPFSLNPVSFEMMLDDISDYNPELFIIDFEPISALIAGALDIPFISCSPLHLLDGVSWNKRKRNQFKNITQQLKFFDLAIEKLIYSPFGMLQKAPELNDGFDWIKPYPYLSSREGALAIKNKVVDGGGYFCSGSSASICDGILQNKKICVADDPTDIEAAINGVFVDSLDLGMSIGKAEENMSYASVKIDAFWDKSYNYNLDKECDLLHERVV